MNLRPYQLEALAVIKAKYNAGVMRQLLVLPTGTGKTCVFAAVPKTLGIKRRTLILVHREELAAQAADKVFHWNPDLHIGIEMGELRAGPDADVVVASVQTLGRKNSARLLALNPEEFGLVITDEAHHSTADSYQAIYSHLLIRYPQRPILHLGVTATPNRADGEGLSKVYDEIVYQMGILDAIKEGWLVNVRGFRISTEDSLDDIHTRAGDFAIDELSNRVNNYNRNTLVVKHWIEKAQSRPTLVFCVDIAHAQAMARTFKDRGILAEAVWGEDTDRAEKLDNLRNGKIKVLCNCAVLTEGYDDWHISCIVMARPTKSQLLFVQCSGRGTRIPNSLNNLEEARKVGLHIAKDDCIVLDVVDATIKHSLVTLPQLFGMSRSMDMAGRTVTAALDHFNKVQGEYPNADLSKADDLTKLRSYAVSVDLFTMKWANEILEAGSKLQWHKGVDGHYILYLHNGRLDVYEDLLQRWNIVGRISNLSYVPAVTNEIDDRGIDDLTEALRMAENYVKLICPEEMTLVRREAKWHKDLASPAQISLLRKFRIPVRPGLTKGEAQLAISKLIKRS